MEELQKDLLEVFEKHGMKILQNSVRLELSPIHTSVTTNYKIREVVLSFEEAVFISDDILKDYIERHGIILEC